MEEDKSNIASDFLLDGHFLSTTGTMLDVHNDVLTIEFNRIIIKFNVYYFMKNPHNVSCVYICHRCY